MAKIVYLIGAGASRGIRTTEKAPNDSSVNKIVEGMPVVNEIDERLECFHNEISNAFRQQINEFDNVETHDINTLLSELSWLREEASKHATIDTFAKKLFLTKDIESYNSVKFLLSLYFFMEQITNKPDSRYDTFYANLLTTDLKLPDDIKILSWNYDSQFEMTYREYDKSIQYKSIKKRLGICDLKDENVVHDPSIIKLNGTAGFKKMDDPTCFKPYGLGSSYVLKQLAKRYGSVLSGDLTTLSFAWDNEKNNNFDVVSNCVNDAEALVVIGYSFPFFNISIDRDIFRNMKCLKHIYLQDPNAEKIKERLRPYTAVLDHNIANKIKTEIITDCSQFCIPDEL